MYTLLGREASPRGGKGRMWNPAGPFSLNRIRFSGGCVGEMRFAILLVIHSGRIFLARSPICSPICPLLPLMEKAKKTTVTENSVRSWNAITSSWNLRSFSSDHKNLFTTEVTD